MQLAILTYFREKHHVNLDAFPYFYNQDFEALTKNIEDKKLIIIEDEKGNSMVCRKWINKFLEILQPLYPPLDPYGNRLEEEQEREFLNKFVAFAKKNNIAQRITQPENFAIFKCPPEKSTSARFGTYCLDLENKTETELFKNLHTKNRNVIRNAEKNNVQLRYGKEVIKDFYLLYEQTMLRSNMYCQELSYFEKFFDAMPENTVCGVAYFNNKPQGALFIPYTSFGAFYLYGASAQDKEINGAINYLHWEVIKLLKNKGVKRYDFVGARLSDISGTKLEGIQQFKERFGAKLEKGYLWKLDLNKFDCLTFDILIQLKHSLNKLTPPLDIIDEEQIKQNLLLNPKYYSLNRKIKNKISTEKQLLNKSLRTFKKAITSPQLLKDLESSGIEKGDTLLIHSSLSMIGNLKEGSKTVLDAILKHVGPYGNIAMPAYSYVDSMENTAKMPDYIFDPHSSPSKVGKITEEFRKLPGVERSIHPTHSICAFGPKAGFITGGHLSANTNFGKNTPFHKIRELQGKIVGLGINIGPVTIYHTLEDFFPELFKNVYLPDSVPINVLVNGVVTTKKIFIHNPAFHTDRIDKNSKIETWLHSYFKEKGILHESAFGKGTLWWMDIQQLFDELLLLRKKNISIYNVPAA